MSAFKFPETWSGKVSVINREDKLNLYHYAEDPTDPELFMGRGPITEVFDVEGKSVEKIVCPTIGHIQEYTDMNDIKTKFEPILSECRFEQAKEGVLLRVWWRDTTKTWMISTYRRINAFNSKWGGNKSHAEMLHESINYIKQSEDGSKLWLSNLKRDRIYNILMLNNYQNRIVSVPPIVPEVYSYREIDANTMQVLDDTVNTSDFPRLPLVNFSNIDDLLKHIPVMDYKTTTGLLVYHKNQIYKITNNTYKDLCNLRSNNPNIFIRYYELKDTENIQTFCKLYDEHKATFEKLDETLDEIVVDIHRNYLRRFVYRNEDGSKEFILQPQEQWFVSKSLHAKHIESGRTLKITQQEVKKFINELPAKIKFNMINSEWTRRYAPSQNE